MSGVEAQYAIIERAREVGVRIAVAESLTGGRLISTLIDVPGASQVIAGGIVSYHTALKHDLLAVDTALLQRRGPVDAEVATQMARGVREACALPTDGALLSPRQAVDIGISTTGVAGPDPDPQTGQPAGTVWVGLSHGASDTATELHLAGDRQTIRQATVDAALRLLRLKLESI